MAFWSKDKKANNEEQQSIEARMEMQAVRVDDGTQYFRTPTFRALDVETPIEDYMEARLQDDGTWDVTEMKAVPEMAGETLQARFDRTQKEDAGEDVSDVPLKVRPANNKRRVCLFEALTLMAKFCEPKINTDDSMKQFEVVKEPRKTEHYVSVAYRVEPAIIFDQQGIPQLTDGHFRPADNTREYPQSELDRLEALRTREEQEVELRKDIAEMRAEMEGELESEKEAIRAELNKKTEDGNAYIAKQIAEAEKTLTEFRTKKVQDIEDYEKTEMERINAEFQDTMERLAQANEQYSQVTQQLAEKQEELRQLSKELQKTDRALTKKKPELADIESRLKELRAEFKAAAEKSVADRMAALDQRETKLDTREQVVATREKSVDKLEEQAYARGKADLSEELGSVTDKIERANKNVIRAVRRHTSF